MKLVAKDYDIENHDCSIYDSNEATEFCLDKKIQIYFDEKVMNNNDITKIHCSNIFKKEDWLNNTKIVENYISICETYISNKKIAEKEDNEYKKEIMEREKEISKININSCEKLKDLKHND
ncbi:hypothetical protein ACFLY2_02650 [Patescibacteria group bacterium]